MARPEDKWITVEELIKKLSKVKNKKAIVVLCELDREYEPFSRMFDETVFPPDADGNIGVVSLALSRDERERRRARADYRNASPDCHTGS